MVEATSMVSPAICGDNLKSSSPREFARLIERGGATLFRVNGSRYTNEQSRDIVRLAVADFVDNPLKTGLLGHLVRLAELSNEELELKDA